MPRLKNKCFFLPIGKTVAAPVPVAGVMPNKRYGGTWSGKWRFGCSERRSELGPPLGHARIAKRRVWLLNNRPRSTDNGR